MNKAGKILTAVNSNAMNGYTFGTKQIEIMPVWEIVMITVSALIGAAWLAWGTILILDGTGKTHIVYELTNEPVAKKKKEKHSIEE